MNSLVVPCLYFHHVNTWMSSYTNCPPQRFELFMRSLSARYVTRNPSQILDALQIGGALPGNCISLAFDDAYADILDTAVPLLMALGMNAAVYPIADYIGRGNDWNVKREGPADHMSATDLRMLVQAGFEIGSHGATHTALNLLSDNAAERELGNSKRTLEDALGIAIRVFAYPYGIFTPAALIPARTHYEAAFSTTKSESRDWRKDRHALRRTYLSTQNTAAEICRVIDDYRKDDCKREGVLSHAVN